MYFVAVAPDYAVYPPVTLLQIAPRIALQFCVLSGVRIEYDLIDPIKIIKHFNPSSLVDRNF